MDIYVEKQCVERLKKGEHQQFLLLFDAYFDDLYKYVVRRVGKNEDAEKVVRLTFLDALGQARNTPSDTGYVVWLYSLARPRVAELIEEKGFPDTHGIITNDEKMEEQGGGREVFERAEKMFGKLSMEEREILRLKFFEEVSDGDVMTVLGMDEGTIGPKIYRVLKRAHFLLFGGDEGQQGVYFGELSGFLARMRGLEEIEVAGSLKINLRADLSGRIERRDFAFEGEAVTEKKRGKSKRSKSAKGSDDPAKIFVEAVREMKEDEEKEKVQQSKRAEKWESFFDVVERWKFAIASVPVVVFVGLLAWGIIGIIDFEDEDELVKRGMPTICEVEIIFKGDFGDSEKRDIGRNVGDRICKEFEVEGMKVFKGREGEIDVFVDSDEWMLEYVFVKKVEDWRIKRYARTPYSDQKSGEV